MLCYIEFTPKNNLEGNKVYRRIVFIRCGMSWLNLTMKQSSKNFKNKKKLKKNHHTTPTVMRKWNVNDKYL